MFCGPLFIVVLWHVYPGGFSFPLYVCPLYYVFLCYFCSPISLLPFVFDKKEVGWVENGRVRVSSYKAYCGWMYYITFTSSLLTVVNGLVTVKYVDIKIWEKPTHSNPPMLLATYSILHALLYIVHSLHVAKGMRQTFHRVRNTQKD